MGKGRRVKIDEGGRADKILRKQLKAFRKKFGRDPEPGEPVFFDPDADTPQPIPKAVMEEGMREVAKLLPPQIGYAYLKTGGLLLTEDNMHKFSDEDLEAWNAAIDEYYEMQEDEPN